MKKKLYKNSGITLIALIVTIVILLILAGITLNLILGDNGIIEKAKEAKDKTIAAQQKEKLELDYIDTILGVATSESEEELMEVIKDAITRLNIRGIYKIKVTIDQDNGIGKFVLDCVREDNNALYRSDTGFTADINSNGGMMNIRDVIVESVQRINTIDDEAMPLYLIAKNLVNGKFEIPEEITIIDERNLIYNEQSYTLVATQDVNTIEIYLQKIKTIVVADGEWKDVVMDEAGASAMAIDNNDDLYCLLKDNGNYQLISSTTPKFIMGNVNRVIGIGEEEYYIETNDNKWYYFDYWNNNNLSYQEISELEQMNIVQFVNGAILDEEGNLWEIYNGRVNTINEGTKFKNINENGLFEDIDGNMWSYYTNLSTLEQFNIPGKKIIDFYDGYECKIAIYDDGDIRICNRNDEIMNWSGGKVKSITQFGWEDLIILCENNDIWIVDTYEITLTQLENKGINFEKAYCNYLLDENNNLWIVSENGINKLSAELNNKNIEKVASSKYGIIFIDSNQKMYQFNYFGTGPR